MPSVLPKGLGSRAGSLQRDSFFCPFSPFPCGGESLYLRRGRLSSRGRPPPRIISFLRATLNLRKSQLVSGRVRRAATKIEIVDVLDHLLFLHGPRTFRGPEVGIPLAFLLVIHILHNGALYACQDGRGPSEGRGQCGQVGGVAAGLAPV